MADAKTPDALSVLNCELVQLCQIWNDTGWTLFSQLDESTNLSFFQIKESNKNNVHNKKKKLGLDPYLNNFFFFLIVFEFRTQRDCLRFFFYVDNCKTVFQQILQDMQFLCYLDWTLDWFLSLELFITVHIVLYLTKGFSFLKTWRIPTVKAF